MLVIALHIRTCCACEGLAHTHASQHSMRVLCMCEREQPPMLLFPALQARMVVSCGRSQVTINVRQTLGMCLGVLVSAWGEREEE